MKTVFSTDEAAKICKVSQETIIRCINDGQLKGIRVQNPRFQLIYRNSLRTFMTENGIPTDALDTDDRSLF